MKLSKEDLEQLAESVKSAILHEFDMKHLSRNLMDAIEIKAESEEKIQVIINAPTYNMYKYFMEGGVVIPNGRGSYASRLNDEGSSFMIYWGTKKDPHRKLVEPRNHIGYIERVINEALNNWLIKKSDKYKLESRLEV